MKGSRVETIEAARKQYVELLKEGLKKTVFLEVIFDRLNILFVAHVISEKKLGSFFHFFLKTRKIH